MVKGGYRCNGWLCVIIGGNDWLRGATGLRGVTSGYGVLWVVTTG